MAASLLSKWWRWLITENATVGIQRAVDGSEKLVIINILALKKYWHTPST